MNKRNLLYVMILAALVLFTTGCNKQIFDFKYTYDKIICNYNGDKFELKIDKWNDYDGEQIQVVSDNKTYLLSANNCYLVDE